jgi:hypothetical protein
MLYVSGVRLRATTARLGAFAQLSTLDTPTHPRKQLNEALIFRGARGGH